MAAEVRIGRFDLGRFDLSAALGLSALAAVAAVPVLHTPAALLFLLTGMLLASVRPGLAASALVDNWALLVLPVFCVLSTLWSLFPSETLRHAVQLGATFVIAILIARRVPFPTAIVAVFATLFALVFLSVVAGPYRADTGALVGLYGSKNEMAGMSALMALVGFGLAVAPDLGHALRLLGLFGFLTGIAGVVLAQSLGALGYLPSGLAGLVAIIVIRRMRLATGLVAGLFTVLALFLVGIAAVAQAEVVAAAFVDLTGKDLTLTGRVELWQDALARIAERPLLGIGYQAFWVQGHPPAEDHWAYFGIESRSGFNFHNTYFSNAVEIGIVGTAIQAALIAAAVVLSGRLAFRSGDRGAALLFGMNAMMVVVTLFEVPIFFQFNLQTVLMVLTVVYARDGLRRLRSAARRPAG